MIVTKYNKIYCIAFDCFGTLFDMKDVPREEIAAYVKHVRSGDFTPYVFPASWYELKTHPDVFDGIKMLQDEGFACIALSNGSKRLLETVAFNNGIQFDHVIDLESYRVYKPHVDAYRTVENDTDYRPHETLMVTANPAFGDLEGAAAVGMRSCVIRNGHPSDVIELAKMLIQ